MSQLQSLHHCHAWRHLQNWSVQSGQLRNPLGDLLVWGSSRRWPFLAAVRFKSPRISEGLAVGSSFAWSSEQWALNLASELGMQQQKHIAGVWHFSYVLSMQVSTYASLRIQSHPRKMGPSNLQTCIWGFNWLLTLQWYMLAPAHSAPRIA